MISLSSKILSLQSFQMPLQSFQMSLKHPLKSVLMPLKTGHNQDIRRERFLDTRLWSLEENMKKKRPLRSFPSQELLLSTLFDSMKPVQSAHS